VPNYNQVAGDHRIIADYGNINKIAADGSGSPVRPNPRSAHLDYCLEVYSQSNCNSSKKLMVINPKNHKIYYGAGETKEIRYYVQSVDALTNAELSLTASYLDGTTSSSRSFVTSANAIDARADEDDWSQYLSVTVTPAADGYVYLELDLMKYINSGSSKYVWVWPLPIEVCESPVHYGLMWVDAETVTYQKDAVDANLVADAVWEKLASAPVPVGSYGEKVGALKSAYAWKRTA
jgi:hypothetical protein